MDSNHDGWAHLQALLQDLGADTTLTDAIKTKCSALYTAMNGGSLTVLNERDAQDVCEAIMQSVRNTKSKRT
jgi:hypothetical protein